MFLHKHQSIYLIQDYKHPGPYEWFCSSEMTLKANKNAIS
jgi:hypothetical protein